MQHGVVTRDQLVLAFAAWTGSNGKGLADLMAEQGALDAPRRVLLDAIADAHLQLHGGDPEKSLAALDIRRSRRDGLAAAGVPEVEATLAHIGGGSGSDADADRTTPTTSERPSRRPAPGVARAAGPESRGRVAGLLNSSGH